MSSLWGLKVLKYMWGRDGKMCPNPTLLLSASISIITKTMFGKIMWQEIYWSSIFCFSPALNHKNGTVVRYSSFICTTRFLNKSKYGNVILLWFKTEGNHERVGYMDKGDIRLTSHSCTCEITHHFVLQIVITIIYNSNCCPFVISNKI